MTPDRETGIGDWTEAQFRRALVEGIRPDNRPLRYPMVPFRGLSDEELTALYAYLRSIPAIRNHVPAPIARVDETGDRGKQIYSFYACNSCHGDTGRGQADLTKASLRYPTDEGLIAYIKHPEEFVPGVALPTWDGVIREEEYAPLAAYVRTLGQRAER